MIPQRLALLALLILVCTVLMGCMQLNAQPNTVRQTDPACWQWWDMDSFFRDATAVDVWDCVTTGADINAQSDEGESPLHMAAINGNSAAVHVLIEAGADINARHKYGATPIHGAAINGNPAVAKKLIDAGADVRVRNNDGNTPLHLAVLSSPIVTGLLIEAGADVNTWNSLRNTPLHIAMTFVKIDAAMLLLEAGADPLARNAQGENFLSLAKKIKPLMEKLQRLRDSQ